MVSQKKGATPAKGKQVTKIGKKPSADPLSNADDEMVRTPANKTPKGRQSQSAKKVSFSISQNTPQRNITPSAKRQATPASKGKTAAQGFKGMKGGNLKKVASDDDDDSDDDDIDEEDEDDIKMEEFGEDDEEDEDEGGEDEDEDEDDEDEDEDGEDEDEDGEDEDEDEEDEDEDEEDEDGKIQSSQVTNKNGKVKKNTKKQETSSEESEEEEEEDENEQQVVKKQEKKTAPTLTKTERDAISLYVEDLPFDVTIEELKALSADIDDVYIPIKASNTGRYKFAFLRFGSEAEAEKNYAALQNKTIREKPIRVDYTGAKRTHLQQKRALTVSNLPQDVKISEIASHFPAAYGITLQSRSGQRNAFIGYSNELIAAEELQKANKIVVRGKEYPVDYSSIGYKQAKTSGFSQTKRPPPPQGKGKFSDPPAKRARTDSD